MAEEKKYLTLRTSDSEDFIVPEAVMAMQSGTIKNMLEEGCGREGVIPLYNVDSKTLSKIIEYCIVHSDQTRCSEQYDKDFVMVDSLSSLCDLIMAANYLEIKGLMSLLCQKVADLMKGKTPEEIRKFFNIKNDYTPDEEAQVRKEIAWAWD